MAAVATADRHEGELAQAKHPYTRALLAALLALAGCRQDMHDQPRFKPLAESDFYTDLRSARPPVCLHPPRRRSCSEVR